MQYNWIVSPKLVKLIVLLATISIGRKNMKNISIFTSVLVVFFLLLIVNNASAVPDVTSDKFDIENAGALTGRLVLEDGTPFPYGFVAFFENVDGSDEHQDFGLTKRSPKMVAFIQKDGKFTTQLFPSGEYFVGAVVTEKWVGGAPKKDQKKYSAINSKGNYLRVNVKAAETVDIGDVTVREPVKFPELKVQFTVTGKVLDAEGNGVPDSVVVAKKDLSDPKGIFISEDTDKDGNYQLKITPGTFYFVARKSLTRAGRPKPGALMGTLGQTKPLGIRGKSDQPPAYISGSEGDTFNNVDIIMFEVPIPDVKRQETEALVKAKKIDKSTLPDDLPLMKQKPEDTVPSDHKPE